MPLEPDQYTQLRLLFSEGNASLLAKVTEQNAALKAEFNGKVADLRSDIRDLMTKMEQQEKTAEMRSQVTTEQILTIRKEADVMRSDVQSHSSRLAVLERYDSAVQEARITALEKAAASTTGERAGADRLRTLTITAIGALATVLGIVAFFIGAAQGGS